MKLPLSVSLISFNEEINIERTINAVKDIASEIIIVDSFSTDETKVIAENMGCKVFVEDWKGFAEQKQSSLNKCTQEWILCLDCDEVLSEELKKEIIDVIKKNNNNSYSINRRTVYINKVMKYSWQPDRKLRLVKNASNPLWIGDEVHESLRTDFPECRIEGDLLHYSYLNISHHFNKAIDYAKISAKVYNKKGKKANLLNLLINPTYAFVNMYFLKFGLLDGWRGLVAAFSSFFGTFMKYAILFELQSKDN